jgi:hypothetical protein
MAPHHVLLLSLAVLTITTREAAGQDRKIREYASRCKGQGSRYRASHNIRTVRLWSHPAVD